MNPRLIALLALALLPGLALSADIPPPDVVLAVPAESYGQGFSVNPMPAPGANGGAAVELSGESIMAGGVKLDAGKYTLVLRNFAPAGDQDGFFVEINGTRTRRVSPIGSWGTLAFPFTVDKPGQSSILVIGQEPGMLVDDVVVVKGTYQDGDVDTTRLVSAQAGKHIDIAQMERLRTGCRLQDWPPQADGPKAVLQQSFETLPPGVTGEHRQGPGQAGQALFLDMPDGRYETDTAALGPMPAGTVEWWVKPRPAALVWSDQGWHYFLHGAPAQPDAVRLDLSRAPATQFQLAVQSGDKREALQMSTSGLDLQQWHHLLVSWDFRGDKQYLWLLVDGRGLQSFFPKTFAAPQWRSLQFANTPVGADIPFLPMDGGLDEIKISGEPVTDRLAR